MPRRRRPPAVPLPLPRAGDPDQLPAPRRRRGRAGSAVAEATTRIADASVPPAFRALVDASTGAVGSNDQVDALNRQFWETRDVVPVAHVGLTGYTTSIRRSDEWSAQYAQQPIPSSNSEHARFSPSSAYRWLACARSVALIEQMQRAPGYVAPPDGEAALNGRRLHAYAEWKLRQSYNLQNGPCTVLVGTDELQSVRVYVDYVKNLTDFLMDVGPYEVSIEERLDTGLGDCWGTADAVVVCSSTHEVWIIDFKSGRQRVLAQENPQLMIYALGWLERNNYVGPATLDDWKFHLVIVQPADEEIPIKSWTTDVHHLDQVLQRVQTAINAADSPTSQLFPGSHCDYCPAAAVCPALAARTTSVFDTHLEGATLSRPPATWNGTDSLLNTNMPTIERLTPQQVAFFLQNRETIRGFLKAVEERARTQPPPGFKVVEGNTRRKWRHEGEAMEALMERGHGDLLRKKLPTIGDAERDIGRTAWLQALLETPRGSPVVVPNSDPRVPYNPGNEVFRVEQLE